MDSQVEYKVQINLDIVNQPVFAEYKKKIRGEVYVRGSEDQLQQLMFKKILSRRWNADVLNNPLILVRPVITTDIVETINFVRDNNIGFGIISGGHGQKSVNVDGLLLDLSLMKGIHVDDRAKTVLVQAGVNLGELDTATTTSFGLGVPTGHASTTGVSGLTLGGGVGHLSRCYGLTIDCLLECEIVTYNGQILKCSKDRNQDLFWAIRGAGANFGVVTSYLFTLHPIDTLLVGTFVYPAGDASREALIEFGKVSSSLPNDISIGYTINHQALVVLATYNRVCDEAQELLEKLSKIGRPVSKNIAPVKHTVLQSITDHRVPHQQKYYQSGPFLKEEFSNEEFVDRLLKVAYSHPTKTGAIIVTHLGGKVSEISNDATAYSFRSATYQAILFSVITEDSLKKSIQTWTAESYTILSDYILGEYVNTTDRSSHINPYGSNHSKLIDLKHKYDPINLFRANINILQQ